VTKKFNDLIVDALVSDVSELFPWNLNDKLVQEPKTLLLDIRESDEFAGAHIANSLHVPRGILEQACEWNYAETIPELVNARQRPVIVICRSGNRSVLAAQTLKRLGYEHAFSLKTGIKGWNDADLPLLDVANEPVDPDWAEVFFNPPVSDEQLAPNNRPSPSGP
jgi:rhodanese-related sulfurtransferase